MVGSGEETVGSRIAAHRKLAGYTPRELVNHTHLSFGVIRAVEQGDRLPTYGFLNTVARAQAGRDAGPGVALPWYRAVNPAIGGAALSPRTSSSPATRLWPSAPGVVRAPDSAVWVVAASLRLVVAAEGVRAVSAV
jgi:transcriptional regulator with XRE-family HTH domain